MAGADLGCDWQNGRAVIGLFASYSWAFGHLQTVGINTDLTLGVRAGYLIHGALAYMLVGWNRVDTDGGNVDGYKIGGGIECRSAVELSRFVVKFLRKDFSENLCWQFIEQRCRELYALDCTRMVEVEA